MLSCKNKTYLLMILWAILSLVIVSCDNNTTDNANTSTPDSLQLSESTDEKTEAANPVISQPEAQEIGFSGLESISDLVQEGVDKLNDAADEEDDIEISSAVMPTMFINDTLVMSTLLDVAMNGSQETYENPMEEFMNGSGKGASSLLKDGSVFTWTYEAMLNTGDNYITKVIYNSETGFVEITKENIQGRYIDPLWVQIKRIDDKTCVASKSEISLSRESLFQLVYFYDGKDVFTAYKRIDQVEHELPVDLSTENIQSYTELMDDAFTTSLEYHNETLTFKSGE